jgi:hypothetical protein
MKPRILITKIISCLSTTIIADTVHDALREFADDALWYLETL